MTKELETLVVLVGEQPIPNLLPVLHLQPRNLVLVHTSHTQAQAHRLAGVLEGYDIAKVETSAYDMVDIRDRVGQELTDRGWRSADTVFNLTGGTKTMAFAVYELAVRMGLEFVYLQSEAGRSLLYRYVTSGGTPHLKHDPQQIGDLITLDQYIRAHVSGYTKTDFAKGDGGLFERAICEAMDAMVDEVMANVRFDSTQEVDFIFRRGNRVAVAEAKTGSPKKDGLDQLAAVCSRENLGTYTGRALIAGQSWREAVNLRDLAAARTIELVELDTYRANQPLDETGRRKLASAIDKLVGQPVHGTV